MQVVVTTSVPDPVIEAIARFNGRKVLIKNPLKHHFLYERDGKLHASRDRPGKEGHFLVIVNGNIVQFQTHHGHFVSIDSFGKVHPGHHMNSENAKFFVELHNGHFAFRNLGHGRYIGISKHGHLKGRHSLGKAETLELIHCDNKCVIM
jgi:hypothetical protein